MRDRRSSLEAVASQANDRLTSIVSGALVAGVENWNTFRGRHKGELDLSGCDFGDVFGTHLDDASDFSLNGYDFSRCNLRAARFDDGSLLNVRFDYSDLTDASFSRGNLSNARFDHAILIRSDLSSAVLRGTDFSNAEFGDTRVCRTNIAEARGLLTVNHRFTSIVDAATLEATRRGVHEVRVRPIAIENFLLACGVDSTLAKWSCGVSLRTDVSTGESGSDATQDLVGHS